MIEKDTKINQLNTDLNNMKPTPSSYMICINNVAWENVVGAFVDGVATISLKKTPRDVYMIQATPVINNSAYGIKSVYTNTASNTATVILLSSFTGNCRLCVTYPYVE